MNGSHPAEADGVSARVVALLALAAFINYVDRGNLATAGPLIRDEFALSNAQLGLLLSAFFWSYAPGQLPAGWLAERFNARLILAAGLAIWGTATALAGLASGFLVLLVLRVILGVGECVMYPASFKILSREARAEERGYVNGWLAAGQLSGPAFGTLAGGLLMARFGWRIVFVAAGCASLLWLWPWLRTPPAPAARNALPGADGPSTSVLLRRRELWGLCLGNFCQAYSLYLVLSWLPVYLVKTRGFSIVQMASLGAGVYALSALASVLSGWAGDRWLRSGASSTRVRLSAALGGLAGIAAGMSACAFVGPLGSVLAMAACGVGLGIVTPAIWASLQTLAGPRASARWMGVQNFCANLAGVAAPALTGVIVDRSGSFASAFVIAALIALIGMLALTVVVRRIEPIDWSGARSPAPARLAALG